MGRPERDGLSFLPLPGRPLRLRVFCVRASSSGRRIPAPNFAYEPINHGRVNLATFHLEDMQITVKFNLVHVN